MSLFESNYETHNRAKASPKEVGYYNPIETEVVSLKFI